MIKPRWLLRVAALALCGLLASCVTINIYFPAAAAQKAADKIINEVWRLKASPRLSKPKTGTVVPQSQKGGAR